MREYLRNAGLFVLVLSIVTLMRWALSLFGVPYDKGTDKASIFVATVYASIFYGAFGRRWRGYGIGQAAMQGLLLGFLAQLVVLGSTILSYALGLNTYFNHPLALNQPDAAPGSISPWAALLIRLGGLMVNTILNGIAGALGWVLGLALPRGDGPPAPSPEGLR
jgi:hypothetical protein